MKDVILDAGALIAIERGDQRARAYVLLAGAGHLRLVTSSGVVAQVWRGGGRQARLARLLDSDLLEEVPLDPSASRRIGALAAQVGASDVVDGHVALLALERDAVVATGDTEDIARWGVGGARIARC